MPTHASRAEAGSNLAIAGDFALPVDAVTETFAILARRGMGKTMTASVMTEEMIGAGLPVCVLDPTGAWWGLRSSADGSAPGLPVVIFGGERADVPLDEHAGRLLAEIIVEQRFPAVIDLSLLSKSAARRFVADFAETLYLRNREPLHLVVDECDLYMPQRTFAGMERLVGAMDDIVRRGRLRGLGVTLISQRPAVVNKDVLSQVGCLIVLGLTGTHDIGAIDDWVRLHADPEEAKAVKASLPSLPVGAAWVWSPGWLGILQRIKVRMRHTFDSSATPKVGQRRIIPRQWAQVDVGALSDRLAVGAASKHAGEPREAASLRAEVARLRAELTKAQADVRQVEVPVLTPEVGAQLQSLARSMDVVGIALNAVLERFASPNGHARPPAPAATPAPSRSTKATPRQQQRPSDDTVKLTRAERAILTVLAQHPAGRTRVQLALLSGYSIKSSSLTNALGALRAQGLVTRGGEPVQATPEGMAVAASLGDVEHLPTGRALYEWWAGRLGRAERAVLDVLVAAWPHQVGRDDLAARSGYSATSSSLTNALGKLRSLDLVDGWAASSELMEAIREDR